MRVMLDAGAHIPTVSHDGDAGYDFYSREDAVIPAGGSYIFDTGVHVEMPTGYYFRVSPRSGLNALHNIVTFGSVIDNGYRGSIRVKLYNLTEKTRLSYPGEGDYSVKAGDRICQLVLSPYITPELEVVETLDDTERGTSGFGSTGR